MGSDESHFNVSVGSDGQRHKTVSTNHNLFEEKGEPKRNRHFLFVLYVVCVLFSVVVVLGGCLCFLSHLIQGAVCSFSH